jgi:ElaB/YqjD/DUF883 family membrane-anchored ribosome-binding protein
MENEDVIRQQMEETRTSLAEKVETLEQKLASTVQETTEAVSDTVQETAATVTETVAAVKETMQESVETVKGWFDLGAQVEEHPWGMLAGAAAFGFVLGNFLPAREPTASSLSSGSKRQQQHHNGGTRRPQESTSATSSTSSGPSWLSSFEPELNKLKSLALGAALGTVREMVRSELPSEMGNRLRQIIDDVTTKLGGQPVPSSDYTEMAESAQEHGAEEEQEPHQEHPATGQEGKKKHSSKHHERFKMQ